MMISCLAFRVQKLEHKRLSRQLFHRSSIYIRGWHFEAFHLSIRSIRLCLLLESSKMQFQLDEMDCLKHFWKIDYYQQQHHNVYIRQRYHLFVVRNSYKTYISPFKKILLYYQSIVLSIIQLMNKYVVIFMKIFKFICQLSYKFTKVTSH